MKKTRETKKAARMSDAAVQAKTGKTWAEWFAILDAAGARKIDHKAIATYLCEQQKVPGWWAQMVTVGYEQERGLREKYQKPSGYAVSGSRTIAVPVAKLYAAWEDKETRARWLKENIVIRKATPGKSMRITWADGQTSVDVNFYPKGGNTTQVTVQHSKLADAKQAERMKAYWAERLERLQGMLEAWGSLTLPGRGPYGHSP